MSNRRAMALNVVLWILSLLLAYLFVFQGLSKFPDSSRWARAFAQWHFPVWFRLLIGVLELAAAALLLWPRTAFLGALTVIVLMLGGMATHIWWGHPEQSFHEAVPLVVATIIAIGRRRAFVFPISRSIATAAMLLAAPVFLGADIPPARVDMIGAEIYGIDQSHSRVGFSIDFLGLSTVHGAFNEYVATILYDEAHPERSSATIIISAASIDTGSSFRDRDLKSPKFFDVEKYPEIRFRSTRLEAQGNNRFLVHGNLTIKDVTKEIVIPMTRTITRRPDALWGNIRIGGNGGLLIHRKEFNVTGGESFNMLTDDVNIELEVLGNRFNYDKFNWSSGDKPSIGALLFKTAEEKDGAAAAAQLRDLKATHAGDYNFDPGQVGTAVNRLMQRRKVGDALEILKAAVELWPDEPGFHARAGEAYATLGNRDDAVREYEKTLALNPRSTEALEMLRRLKGA